MKSQRLKCSTPIVALLAGFIALTGLKGAPAIQPGLIAAHNFRGKGGIIILDARIGNGPVMPFILDTGANPCVVDPLTAKQLGIQAGALTTGRGGAGKFESKITANPVTITLGKESIACPQTLIIDLSGVAVDVGVRPAGLIGGTFFHGRVVHVDYDRHVLTTYLPAAYRMPRGPSVIPLRVDGNRAFITARLSVPGGPQRVEQSLLIDTGSLDTIDHPMLKESKVPLRPVQGTGIGEGFAGAVGTWAEVKIGPYAFRNINGTVPAVPIVGGGILSRFNLTFDYDRGWLQMTPRKSAASKPR